MVGPLTVGNGSAGTLAISSGGHIGEGGDVFISNGTLTLSDGGGMTVGSNIAMPSSDSEGSSHLLITLVFTGGGNVYIGNSGTLVIGAAAGTAPVAPGNFFSLLPINFGAGTGTIVFNHTDMTGTYEFSPPIYGSGKIDVENGVTVFTYPNSTFSGITKVLAPAKVVIGADNALGTGDLYLTTDSQLGFGTYTISNPIHIGTGDPTFDVPTGDTGTSAGGIVDTDPLNPGDLTKTGGGTLVLSGANTYSGATTVAEGTLQAGAANALSPNSVVTVASGATLDLNGFSQSVPSLTNNGGTINSTGATLTVTGNYTGGGTLEISGALNGGELVVNGNVAGSTVIGIAPGTPPVNTNVAVVQTSSSAAGAFTLAGGALQQTVGNYKYTLFLGDGTGGTVANTWYISAVQVTTVATTASIPTLSESALALLALLLGLSAVAAQRRRCAS
jgi:autotransporter-associated beta strand protein